MKRQFVLLPVLLAVLAGTVRADASNTLDRVRAVFAQITSVQASFTQEKRMALFSKPLIIRGRLSLDSSGALLWRVDDPIRYAMVFRKGTLKQWDEESGKVQTVPVQKLPAAAALMSQLQTWLSGDLTSLSRDYVVRVEQESPPVLTFTPRAAATSFLTSITLHVRDDVRYIRAVDLVEAGGDSSTLRFDRVRLNEAIPPSEWKLPPPHE